MKAHLTRRYMFSASHRLHSDAMSDAENAATYGKCNNPYGHGHNYALEVTVSGTVDREHRNGLQPGRSGRFRAARNSATLRSGESEHAAGIRPSRSRPPKICAPPSTIFCSAVSPMAHLEKVRIEETMMNSFEYAGGAEIRPLSRNTWGQPPSAVRPSAARRGR